MPESQPERLLLIDDDEAITDSLGPFLSRTGFETRIERDGAAGLEAVKQWRPTVIVCDVVMPRMDGRTMVRQLRDRGDWTPVLLLTKVGESFERSAALDEGADDYLNKPFDPRELVSRIRALLRRGMVGGKPLSMAERLSSDDLSLDRTSRRVWLSGRELPITPRALLVLEYLMSRPGEAISRDRLLSALWGFDFPAQTRAVDHRIAELRRLLNEDPSQPRFIETVPTFGYRFRGEVRAG